MDVVDDRWAGPSAACRWWPADRETPAGRHSGARSLTYLHAGSVSLPSSRSSVCVCVSVCLENNFNNHHTTTVLWPFFPDLPGEPVPEENFWTYGARED